VVSALLSSESQDCWDFIEKLLLAAQRQEGLRQVILETVDCSHLDAFRYMLRTILEHNFVRFSATVRAVDVWVGMPLDSASAGFVSKMLERLVMFLDDDQARASALAKDDAEDAFLALWAIAFEDAPAAIPEAERLLGHGSEAMRFIAVHVLGMLEIGDAFAPVSTAIDDRSIGVAVLAANVAGAEIGRRIERRRTEGVDSDVQTELVPSVVSGHSRPTGPVSVAESTDLFDRLTKLYDRIPAKDAKPVPLVWPWLTVRIGRAIVADHLLLAIGKRPPAQLLPFLDSMTPRARMQALQLLASMDVLDRESRTMFVKLLGDPAGEVRITALRAIPMFRFEESDLPLLEPLLNRKMGDLRRGVISLILSLDDASVLASAERLTKAKSLSMRLGGLDVLVQMRDAGRAVEQGRQVAIEYQNAHPAPERDEQVYLEKLTAGEVAVSTLDDALGLVDHSRRTPPTPPQPREVKLITPAARHLVAYFDELVHENREQTIKVTFPGRDDEVQPLGSVGNRFPGPFDRMGSARTLRPIEDLPLSELWFAAWDNRPKAARDRDGLEAARALLALTVSSSTTGFFAHRIAGWCNEILESLVENRPTVRYMAVLPRIIAWVVLRDTPAALADFSIDALETLLAAIPDDKLDETSSTLHREHLFRGLIDTFGFFRWLAEAIAENKGLWTNAHTRRMFGLSRWIDEPRFAVPQPPASLKRVGALVNTVQLSAAATAHEPAQSIERSRVTWDSIVRAFEHGCANADDLLDHLLGTRRASLNKLEGFGSISLSSRALRRGALPKHVASVVRRAIDRILEVELARGEKETAATPAALALGYAGGIDVLIRVLQAIGRDPKLQRNGQWWWETKQEKRSVFSHLVRVTSPGNDDPPEAFVTAVTTAGIDETTLLAVAFYAPHWARFVQAALDWPLLEEAVWWFHAHTKDPNWQVDQETREAWNAEIRKLTPLSLEDLMSGAVDVHWFSRVRVALGDDRWSRLDEFAKYASSGAGHKRAQLFAAAMLGQIKKQELLADISTKRKQDAVRALGLLPLDAKRFKTDLFERYQVIAEFARTSREFGSQRQAAERLAARIGQENLARTAGFPSHERLQWAMESAASEDLARGPVVATIGDLVVTLALDPEGAPELSIRRGDKPLKSVPAAAKKSAGYLGLAARQTEIKAAAARMRQALELAMCRGDRFTTESLGELFDNPVLKLLIERLVFVGDGIAGFPVHGGRALRDVAGKIEPDKKDEVTRIAHPVDLLALKTWSEWQRDCFLTERVQPFKQIFRELYVLTGEEKRDASFSRRYAGHQVQPRQALALLSARGWVTAPDAGVFRSFHDEKLVAWLEFTEAFYTPAEIEGLTIE
jgi:hypothetical protein